MKGQGSIPEVSCGTFCPLEYDAAIMGDCAGILPEDNCAAVVAELDDGK